MTLFTSLGSGRAAVAGVGNKAALLDRAARAGLPVPRGVILLDEAWRFALREGLVEVNGDVVTCGDPVRLIAVLEIPRFERPIAVRSAFSAEDGEGESLAGFFTSRLFVDGASPGRLADALCEVWGSALRRSGEFRHDVLLMEMVEARRAGVAFTEREYEDDLVNYTVGVGDRLVSGAVEGETLTLPKLRSWERPPGAGHQPSHSELQFSVRLRTLLREIRREFGAADWDVEWADDGRLCHLVQIRPVTRPTRRNEAFTVANHKEILPELPSRFMTDVIASCAGELFAYYRRFDPELPSHRPFIEVFCGRPLINLSLLSEMMRIWGLPTRLVVDNIGGQEEGGRGLVWGRLARKIPTLLRLAVAQLRAPGSSRRTMRAMLAASEHPGATFGACVEIVRRLYTALVTEMFSLTSAMSAPLMTLRKLDTLEEHGARARAVSTEIHTDLEPLRQVVLSDSRLRGPLEQGRVPADPAFRRLWESYLAKHGHRGIYESDIARPRFREAPETLLSSLLIVPVPAKPMPSRTVMGLLTAPIWWQADRAIRAREEIRYTAMIGFERVRAALLLLADRAVERGALPNRDAIWMMEIGEICRLDEGWSPGDEFFTRREEEIERMKGYRLPDLIHRFDDLERYNGAGHVVDGDRLFGVSLTTGEVEGNAWVLSEPAVALPEGFIPASTILVARSIDAGWIPTFSRVAGVVVETGGDLSHGSIILREIGLPAVTNVRGATGSMRTGERLRLRAGAGVVERLDEKNPS